ncbi:MvaI/BcnI restriction endonuclease family protein [Algoriphagus persicinus]|uniref:MvaI/BcnI restriction endonuclease family protein n=1 Tax=Algoriphagus persicinus TaxID=3108754 RepID=UPI002B3C172E|nr:MvaI/BcnI restriction endonuclease family protein [Algoriphagus sp. E1-3-M2]MEB2784840.1 MvaI/BcnI restriction endonuclease family protein [Algoriphagus sp. E1-3-M2]
MRVLTPEEQSKIKLLTKNQVSISLIEPTETGLKKSIMDATGSVRSFLKENNIHDYDTQGQGQENKDQIEALIYQDVQVIHSTASLYRPQTKKGDPRIWFSGLTKIANPNDIIAIIFFDDCLHIFNLTRLDIGALIDSALTNPFKELITAINFEESEIAIELLNKLKLIANAGYVKSVVNSDTGIGRTIELLLGIEMNSSKSPDYKGIELKSFRDSRNNRKGLFGKTPDWELSKFKSRVEILDAFGYWEKGVFRLYNTIRGTGRNAQGLILKIEDKKDWLVENSDRPEIGGFLVWKLETLRKELLKKHKETFWIKADSKIEDNNEYFHFKEVEHTKNPMIDKFEILVETGAITLDYPIKRMPDGKVIDKGCNFKLKANCLDLLFPPSEIYNLV